MTNFFMQDFMQMGESQYEALKAELEPVHNGKYIAIDLESGEYKIANSREESVELINKDHPGKVPFSRRIGAMNSISRHSIPRYARILR